jgi:hypothetical protein
MSVPFKSTLALALYQSRVSGLVGNQGRYFRQLSVLSTRRCINMVTGENIKCHQHITLVEK